MISRNDAEPEPTATRIAFDERRFKRHHQNVPRGKLRIRWGVVVGIAFSEVVTAAGIATVWLSPNATGAIMGVSIVLMGLCLLQYFLR